MKHFYKLYEQNDELLKIAALFFKEGLEKGEFCFWAIPDSMDKHESLKSLGGYIELLSYYIKKDQIMLVKAREWYHNSGSFDMDLVLEKWESLYKDITARGFTGLRVVGNAENIEEKDWKKLMEYEAIVHDKIKNYNMTAVCAFNIKNLKSVIHISDIINIHEDCFVTD
ncbi:MEDS domain-containing protein [Candidatus Omnitrophota bacterium]